MNMAASRSAIALQPGLQGTPVFVCSDATEYSRKARLQQ
jgi:hypothetical protein